MLDFTFNVARALMLNYPKFSDSCRLLKFTVFINLSDMIVDRTHINVVKKSKHFLGQPDSFTLIADFNISLFRSD